VVVSVHGALGSLIVNHSSVDISLARNETSPVSNRTEIEFMKTHYKWLASAAAAVFSFAITTTTVSADPTIPLVRCTITGPGVAFCTAAAVVANELLLSKRPFGKNGEGMKAARGVCRLAFKHC
jgi:hypothetical protein